MFFKSPQIGLKTLVKVWRRQCFALLFDELRFSFHRVVPLRFQVAGDQRMGLGAFPVRERAGLKCPFRSLIRNCKLLQLLIDRGKLLIGLDIKHIELTNTLPGYGRVFVITQIELGSSDQAETFRFPCLACYSHTEVKQFFAAGGGLFNLFAELKGHHDHLAGIEACEARK